jgi:NAD(P)-dependent dehydrogenase (short-subunit alcohol dehydrogenase family)
VESLSLDVTSPPSIAAVSATVAQRHAHLDVLINNAGIMLDAFAIAGRGRADQKIRAQVKIWSKPGAGTEIDLRVPAEVAYRQPLYPPVTTGLAGWARLADHLSVLFERRDR